ncbi:MAG: hypothetical protein LBL79_12045 [Prevotella sp.]|jgi:hypothetical protein|nr:hypothetical protein [Prevotella sp.]
MKKVFLTWMAFFAAIVAANAQQISVVAPGGATTLYASLDTAITQAAAGSTLYLSGNLSGGGFQVKDETKITKKLTIIGIGHKPDNDNADGFTIISGNLFFEGGSGNSALMGVHLSGNVHIGTGEVAVNNFLLRYCNVNSVQIQNSNCQGIVINQNYIRERSGGGNSAITLTNNVLHSINSVNGGVIDHNIVRYNQYSSYHNYALLNVSNTQISNNILIDASNIHSGSECIIRNNMLNADWGDETNGTIKIVGDWEDVFEGPITGVSPACNYQLKGSQGKGDATDGTDVGIYGGTNFSDAALPPIPRIINKKIAEQTDENGKLNIQVYVKAK